MPPGIDTHIPGDDAKPEMTCGAAAMNEEMQKEIVYNKVSDPHKKINVLDTLVQDGEEYKMLVELFFKLIIMQRCCTVSLFFSFIFFSDHDEEVASLATAIGSFGGKGQSPRLLVKEWKSSISPNSSPKSCMKSVKDNK